MLEIHINPRDVVSVPTDAGGAKMRVCRYTVASVVEAPHTSSVVSSYTPSFDEDYDYDCEECEDNPDLCDCDY